MSEFRALPFRPDPFAAFKVEDRNRKILEFIVNRVHDFATDNPEIAEETLPEAARNLYLLCGEPEGHTQREFDETLKHAASGLIKTMNLTAAKMLQEAARIASDIAVLAGVNPLIYASNLAEENESIDGKIPERSETDRKLTCIVALAVGPMTVSDDNLVQEYLRTFHGEVNYAPGKKTTTLVDFDGYGRDKDKQPPTL